MRYSGIGGQAVMEGIMMKNEEKYAIAVRKPDHEIEIKVEQYRGVVKNQALRKLPIVRGVLGFIESLYLGMSTLMYSASFFEDEEDPAAKVKKPENAESAGKEKKPEKEKKSEKAESTEKEKKSGNAESPENKKEESGKNTDALWMGGTVAFSLIVAFALFFALPYFLSGFFRKFTDSQMLVALLEGLIRLAIFLGYIALISLMPDIRRVFMYHGAEHKCINCIEHGMELNVENVRKSSRQHKRCGTSFLLIVMLISIVFFMFIQTESRILRLVLRLLLIPVIAGVSYEFIRLAGRYDNWFVNLLSKPGLWMQRMTTKEPDDEMIEVGIASVEAVFDWKSWQKEA